MGQEEDLVCTWHCDYDSYYCDIYDYCADCNDGDCYYCDDDDYCIDCYYFDYNAYDEYFWVPSNDLDA